ncbi:hypothetical protein TYRP_013926 [Tyrophagus putrescentiae]|nr:hypothetical protein TYRP_013926 [Tyrophagus putrescentiae]
MSQYYGVHVVLQLPLSLTLIALTLLIAELNVATFYLALNACLHPFGGISSADETVGRAVGGGGQRKQKQVFTESTKQLCKSQLRQQYTRVVILVSKANKYVARAFMPLLAVNCPSNALLTITLLTSQAGRLDLVVQLLTIMVLFEQFLCIFLVHSLLANLNDRLKSIAKKFIPLMYSQKGKGNRKTRLLNYLFLSKFHTSKAYGFTYYKFGRISSFNFVKASCIFCSIQSC